MPIPSDAQVTLWGEQIAGYNNGLEVSKHLLGRWKPQVGDRFPTKCGEEESMAVVTQVLEADFHDGVPTRRCFVQKVT